MRNSVVLRTAFVWCCEECGQEHFCHSMKAEFAPGEKEECFRGMHFLEPDEPLPDKWDEFELVETPKEVTCTRCNSVYDCLDDHDIE